MRDKEGAGAAGEGERAGGIRVEEEEATGEGTRGEGVGEEETRAGVAGEGEST